MSYKPAVKPEKIDGCSVGVTLRNTRQEMPEGTRLAHVVSGIRYGGPAILRIWLERTNRDKVIKAWEKKWGPLDLSKDSVEVRHVHLTCQVSTELIVYPDGY